MFKSIAMLTLALGTSLAFADSHVERKVEIQKWDEVVAPKGYILSNDLFYEKHCAKIWTHQIREFKKENPHIKNPNLILINQKIKVQDCRVEKMEELAEVVEPVKEEVKCEKEKCEKKRKMPFFVLAGLQANKALEGNDRAENLGVGLQLQLGYNFSLSDNEVLRTSVGMLFNNTVNETELADTKEKKSVTTFDIAYLMKKSEKLHIGPSLGMLVGKNGDFSNEGEKSSSLLAPFLGVTLDYKLSERFFVDWKVQQALESRVNLNSVLGLGLRF